MAVSPHSKELVALILSPPFSFSVELVYMSAGAANWQLQLFLSLLFVWSSGMNWRHVQGVTLPSRQDRPLQDWCVEGLFVSSMEE